MSNNFDTFKQIEALEAETYQQQRNEAHRELVGLTMWESVYNVRLRQKEDYTKHPYIAVFVVGDISRYREFPYTLDGIEEAKRYIAPSKRIPDELVEDEEYTAYNEYRHMPKANEY